jgi:hypothetical protein
MALNVDGTSHRVAQMGGDFIILESATELAPTKANLSLIIDGDVKTWEVLLPKGVRKGHPRTPIEGL